MASIYNGIGLEPLNEAKNLALTDDQRLRLKVHTIVSQIQSVCAQGGNRRCTMFFQVVLGGNVKAATKVIEILKVRRLHKELQWILGTSMGDKSACMWFRENIWQRTIRYMMGILLFCFWTLTSPVFYGLHALLVGVVQGMRPKLKSNMQLPLAFAALSRSVQMIQLFIDNGVKFDDIDSHGNNVFHYIADLSESNASTAQEVFEMLIGEVKDRDILMHVLNKQKNSSRLTALEHVSKYGAPTLLARFLDIPGINRHTTVIVNSDNVFVEGIDADECLSCETVSASVATYDVSNYEVGATSRFSSLLNIIANRNVNYVSDEELTVWKKSKFLNKYLRLKVQQLFGGIVFLHTLDIIFTTLFTFWIVTRFEALAFDRVQGVASQDAFLQEIKARVSDKSSILTDDALHRLIPNITDDPTLSKRIARDFFGLQEFSNADAENQAIITNQWEHCKKFCPSSPHRNGPDGSNTPYTIDRLFCIDSKLVKAGNYKKQTDVTQPPNALYHTICEKAGLEKIANQQCKEMSAADVYQRLLQLRGKNFLHFAANGCFVTMLIMSAIYILFDVGERLYFLYICISESNLAAHTLSAISSIKVPGSYTRKQLNIATHFCLLLYVALPYITPLGIQQIEHNIFLVFGLVNRFILHIHSMRLLPGIGHFVITTFRMGTVMAHFSLVYAIILFTFSVVFHILIQNPDCPIQKLSGFSTLGESMFSTFRLVFGNSDDPDAFFINNSVKLTYILYTIICGLLLLNLIIAIMSSLAQDVMASHRMKTFWRAEWLKEALSAELSGDACLLGKFYRIWWLRKAGFIVQNEQSVKVRVYESNAFQ